MYIFKRNHTRRKSFGKLQLSSQFTQISVFIFPFCCISRQCFFITYSMSPFLDLSQGFLNLNFNNWHRNIDWLMFTWMSANLCVFWIHVCSRHNIYRLQSQIQYKIFTYDIIYYEDLMVTVYFWCSLFHYQFLLFYLY